MTATADFPLNGPLDPATPRAGEPSEPFSRVSGPLTGGHAGDAPVVSPVAGRYPAAGAPAVVLTPCHYCGLPADTIDHVVPRSEIQQLRSLGGNVLATALRGRVLTVPACRECNGLAAATSHQTLEARTAFVKGKLRRRYAKTLATPEWSDAELATMRPRLRRFVVAGLEARALASRRVAW